MSVIYKTFQRLLSVSFLFCSVTLFAQPNNVDSLLKVVALEKHDDAEMKALFYLALAYSRSDGAKAKHYLAQEIKVADQAKNYDRLCSAYAMLLTLHQEEGNTDSAALDVDKLKEIATLAPDNNKVQANYNQSLGLYHRKNGNYKAALPFCIAAIKFTEAISTTKSSLAGQWLNAGATYNDLGDYSHSLECYLKALRLFIEDGNKLGESFCYTNIASVYISLKQFDKALSYAQQGLTLKKSIADQRGVCTSLDAIGNAYTGLKKYPEALNNFQAALKIAIAEKMVNEEATCYFNMAKIFVQQQKDSLAVNYFNKTKALANKMGNKTIAADAAMELSALYKSADSLKNAEKIFETSLQTFKDAGSLEKEAENYKRLSEFYTLNRKFDKALEYTNRYHDLTDSIRNNQLQVQIAKMEEQYNVEKKEQEIVLLKKDGELQQQKLFRQRVLFGSVAVLLLISLFSIALLINRNKMRQQMKELELRNQIAADLHDEVGSSLSSIHMLSQMATQQGNEASQKDILSRMSSNAKETMDKMGDIVWMIKPGETEAGSLRQRMERFAYEINSSKNIELSIKLDELEDIKLTMKQRKNIYLIFKEAVNNAVKYSGTAKMKISAAIQDNQLLLQIEDFGKGFDSSVARKGNGLHNMQQRAKELHAELKITAEPASGTLVSLLMPV